MKTFGSNFKFGRYCVIDENCEFGDNVTIGNYCEIQENVTVGNNVIIQGRVRIASGCVIEDNVTIKYGTILTNGVTVKKNAFIGPNVIALGSTHKRETIHGTVIGENSYIGAGTIIAANKKIGNNVIVGAKTFVNKDLIEEGTYIGTPVKKNMNLKEKIEHSKSIIADALKNYGKVRLACSWGKDSMVVLHLALQVEPDIEVFSVLTPYKPTETFDYANMMEGEWDLNLVRYQSSEEVYHMYKTDPEQCCKILKVQPTKEALEGYDAWITGLRNDEGETRRGYKEVEDHGDIVKINPILNWSEREIWQYMACYNIPAHPWYKLGYRSIGCAPCTDIIDDTQMERAGRWKGTKKCGGECGIHTMGKK